MATGFQSKTDLEVFILTGGLSARMGREKSRMQLANKTLMGHVLTTAQKITGKVRTIRKDLVPRCGPLGGIYTGLRRSRTEKVLFLACDMPFVSERLLRKVEKELRGDKRAVFSWDGRSVGFPLILRRKDCLKTVLSQIRLEKHSLQDLAAVLKAKRLNVGRTHLDELMNINSPSEFELARKSLCKPRLSLSARPSSLQP